MPKKTTTKKTASKKSTHAAGSAPKKRLVNKSAFIRGLPNLSGKEVVEKAASEGIKVSLAQVYTARANAKKAAKKGGAKRGPGRPKKSAVAVARLPSAPKSQTRLTGSAADFVNAALNLGLTRAEELLREVRSRLLAWKP